MSTMGQIIKKLRKERNFTQEELAEQLNVTFQAISKWENDTGMPDISQIVPLANVFGVSTDVLFGTYGVNDNDEVRKIIYNAHKLNDDLTKPQKFVWDALQSGLKLFPNNTMLLMASLEYGISLAYPENDCYDSLHGEEIYRECIRQAHLVISYGKNVTDIMRARMIMVLLHSAYGDMTKAREHADNFPGRPDFTIYNMYACIAHAAKNYAAESINFQRDFHYNFTALLDDIILLGRAYKNLGEYDDALKMFYSAFAFMEVVFGDEKLMPPMQNTDSGDVYVLIAQTFLELGEEEKAVEWLDKLVDYNMNVYSQFDDEMLVQTPFVRDLDWKFYRKYGDNRQRLSQKLNSPEFDCIRNKIKEF